MPITLVLGLSCWMAVAACVLLAAAASAGAASIVGETGGGGGGAPSKLIERGEPTREGSLEGMEIYSSIVVTAFTTVTSPGWGESYTTCDDVTGDRACWA